MKNSKLRSLKMECGEVLRIVSPDCGKLYVSFNEITGNLQIVGFSAFEVDHEDIVNGTMRPMPNVLGSVEDKISVCRSGGEKWEQLFVE